jgi:hypothetical protein
MGTVAERNQYRFLEMIPGLLVWLTIIATVLLSIFRPFWAIYFIILFDLYWLIRVLYFIFYLVVSWRRYRMSVRENWLRKLTTQFPQYDEKMHIVFLPFYREGYEVIKHTFDELIKVHYDLKKIIVVLGGEGRVAEQAENIGRRIQAEYGQYFFILLFTLHPSNLPDEIPAKGANSHFMGREAQKYIDEQRIPYKNCIVSYFDIDTVTHREYFAYLTYRYLSVKHPERHSFQPVALFNNNIWESNPITRVAAFGTTFWLFSELARPDRLYTFSSHSMSFQALVDVGFWQKDIVTDDSRIFLQCFFRYDGHYSTVPMYMPVSMDTVDSESIWMSLRNLYKQQRRWAYGVEHFPYLVSNFRKHPLIPFRKKFKYTWNLLEGMYSWASAPLIIFILGRLPLYFIPDVASASVLVQNTPYILEWLLRIAMVGIFVSSLLSLALLPPRPSTKKSYHALIMIFQWFFLPITLIVFGSIPAIDAQTRLMFGKYLGFFNTPKVRKAEM